MLIKMVQTDKKITDFFVVDISSSYDVDVQVRGDVSLTSPTLVLTSDKGEPEFFEYNYIFIPRWKRYYFITNIKYNGNLTFIFCSEDYLATWYYDLLDQEFYCLRSESRTNELIPDSLFPVETPNRIASVSFESPWYDIKNGYYIIGITNGNVSDKNLPHVGCNTYYLMSDSQLNDFVSDLMTTSSLSISGIVDNMLKTMVDPLQYIRSVFWFPFEPSCTTYDVDYISFGWWSSSASAKVIKPDTAEDLYTEFRFDVPDLSQLFENADREYKKYAPYSHYYLTAFPFGVFELSADVVTALVEYPNQMNCRIVIDHITGEGNLIITMGGTLTPRLVTKEQIGVEIPVGEILKNSGSSVLQTASAVASAFQGKLVVAAQDIYNAFDSQIPKSITTGLSGGFAQLMVNHQWNIIRCYSDTTISASLVGEPCCKNVTLRNLFGYAKFWQAQVNGTMLMDEKNAISQLLNGGIFCNG